MIYAMNVDGSEQHSLIQTNGRNFDPVLSPDRTRVAFISTRDGQQEIYVAGVDGSNQQRLTSSGYSDFDPVWSPDGSNILFSRTIGDLLLDINTDLYVIPAGGGDETRLTTDFTVDQHGTWSPDGSQIVFEAAGQDGSKLMQVQPSSGNLHEFIATIGNPTDPAWSPDGSKLTFSRLEVDSEGVVGENRDIYVVNADAGSLTRLTDADSVDFKPVWSPDGALIAYVSIPLREATGSPTPTPTRAETVTPTPRPVPNEAIALPSDIYVMNADGTAPTRVTPDDWDDSDPLWRPVTP